MQSVAIFFIPLLIVALTQAAEQQICRFVCPDTVNGVPLFTEVLEPDGSVNNCFWSQRGVSSLGAKFDSVRSLETSIYYLY